MRVFGDHDEDGGDSRFDRECYRCDRDVAPPRLFRVTVEPPDALSDRYAESVRFCCVDCAAGMNLSEFSEGVKESAHG